MSGLTSVFCLLGVLWLGPFAHIQLPDWTPESLLPLEGRQCVQGSARFLPLPMGHGCGMTPCWLFYPRTPCSWFADLSSTKPWDLRAVVKDQG